MKIIHLKLYSGKLEEQLEFYTEVLELELIGETSHSFTVLIGDSELTFEETQYQPYYHFAINIPSQKIEEARNWISGRATIQQMFDKDIVEFPNWNARAVYFYDRDMNIVELIARKNLNYEMQESDFSSADLIEISEIGVPTSDVTGIHDMLVENLKVQKFSGDLSRFCAMGDETGLFIVVDYNQKDWIPNMDKAVPYPFEAQVEHLDRSYDLSFRDEELDVRLKGW